jgi:hypothetical protein
MSASQRVSRGFHRLAVFLAAVPLLVGVVWSTFVAIDIANDARQNSACAQVVRTNKADRLQPSEFKDEQFDEPSGELRGIPKIAGSTTCSAFNFAVVLLRSLAFGLAITLVISLGIYGLVRAMGWVNGGFAAS